MKKYYQAYNYGEGFITHQDSEVAHIAGFPGPGNIWVTENTAWAQRVNAVEKTKEEAQSIVNLLMNWYTKRASSVTPNITTPQQIILP